jgi:hypothetical protein
MIEFNWEVMLMKIKAILATVLIILVASCATYKVKPVPLRSPASYPNAVRVAEAVVGAEAYSDRQKAKEAFGFDVRAAGMLPVQVVFDNEGPHPLKINPGQTFLEDQAENLWPILSDQIAYERATRYAHTKEIFKEGAYAGFLGATFGALIGAAIGIVAGENVGSALGKGAAIGAAAGGTLGGIKGYTSDEARQRIMQDLNQKSLTNKPIDPKNIAYGFLFFPGEAPSAKQLRLQLVEVDTGRVHVIRLNF